MNTLFKHEPVMLEPVLAWARWAQPQWVVDSTVGGAGHAAALLEALPHARLLGLDRDPEAQAVAQARLNVFGPRAQVVHGRFSQLPDLLSRFNWPQVDLILADFGVSSYQLEAPHRGFSFGQPAPLDMRMDPSEGPAAWQVLAGLNERTLADVLYTLGQERYARKVAQVLVRAKPQTTQSLAAWVRRVVPASADGLDPATRTFQALRMLVNQECDEIDAWLSHAPDLLSEGGLVVAISFHSLEDRAVKRAFRHASQACVCPPQWPACGCDHMPTLKILTRKAQRPSASEIQSNPRSRSARLRAAQRLARMA